MEKCLKWLLCKAKVFGNFVRLHKAFVLLEMVNTLSDLWLDASSFKMNNCIQPGWTDLFYFFPWKRKAYLWVVWSVVMGNNKTTDPFHLLESIPVGTVNKKTFHSCRELSVIQTPRLLSVSLKRCNFLAGCDAT